MVGSSIFGWFGNDSNLEFNSVILDFYIILLGLSYILCFKVVGVFLEY